MASKARRGPICGADHQDWMGMARVFAFGSAAAPGRPARPPQGRAIVAAALAGLAARPAAGESAGPRPLTFEDAATRLERVSDRLEARSAEVRAAEDGASSLKALRRPVIELDAQVLRYQKTLPLSSGDPTFAGGGAVSSALAAQLAALPSGLTAHGLESDC